MTLNLVSPDRPGQQIFNNFSLVMLILELVLLTCPWCPGVMTGLCMVLPRTVGAYPRYDDVSADSRI